MPEIAEQPKAADLIAALAEDHEAAVLDRHGDNLRLQIDLRLTDGRIIPYRLHVEAGHAVVSVREDPVARLPIECFERHITPGGWFCMNWHTVDPLEVVDTASATRWWATLVGYLRRQESASKSGRWPGKEWAHGKAAQAQWEAEQAAEALGPKFVAALDEKRLTVTRRRSRAGEEFLELRIDGRKAWSVQEAAERVATGRQRCVCGRGRRVLTDCGDHACDAAKLVLAMVRWRSEEERFWRARSNSPCCGSMKSCPLRAAAGPARSPADLHLPVAA